MRISWCVVVAMWITHLPLAAQGVPALGRADTVAAASSNAFQYELVKSTFESSYIMGLGGWGTLQDPLHFEGAIAPHYSFVFGRIALVGTPKIVLRMFDEHSQPVRRPSYMPRVTVYHWFPSRRLGDRQGFRYIRSTFWSHHSNGQDGEFYVAGTDSLNTLDGSFSLDYSDVSLGMISMDSVGGPYGTFEVGLRANWPSGESSPLRDSSADKYGSYRLIASGSGSAWGKWQRMTLAWDLQYVVDRQYRHAPFIADERLTTALSLLWSPKAASDVGLLISFYRGQDYYNMSYKNRFWTLRAGLAVNATSTLHAAR